jgi:(1->4)-alpha-D-glucan 1-alpha-D-glucosylmutase
MAEPRIPSSTYRLQFNRHFTFAQAREIVPYLHSLGISDCYASPYFQARAESLHGYDITDHNKLNAAIGTRAEYDAWVAEMHGHSMGQILDFVPNHMGIGEPLTLRMVSLYPVFDPDSAMIVIHE